jgi:hypothetical protein
MEKSKRIFGVIALLVLIVVVVLASFAIQNKFRCYPNRDYASLEEFGTVWRNTEQDQRHCLLYWLLNEPPARFGTFPDSKLIGLHRDQVLQYLGGTLRPADTEYSWQVGAIESPSISDRLRFLLFPVKEYDWLAIEWNEEGIIVRVTTSA